MHNLHRDPPQSTPLNDRQSTTNKHVNDLQTNRKIPESIASLKEDEDKKEKIQEDSRDKEPEETEKKMPPFLDAHCHLNPDSPVDSCSSLINHDSFDPQLLLLMSCHPGDFDRMPPVPSPVHVPFYGIHPWYAHLVKNPSLGSDSWLASLEECLIKDPRAGVGECGLDKASRPQSAASLLGSGYSGASWLDLDSSIGMDLNLDSTTSGLNKKVKHPSTFASHQIPVFTVQLALAWRLRRPISVHCVRAYGTLLDLIKSTCTRTASAAGGAGAPAMNAMNNPAATNAQPPLRLMLHSYTGSLDMIPAFLKLKQVQAFFSLSFLSRQAYGGGMGGCVGGDCVGASGSDMDGTGGKNTSGLSTDTSTMDSSSRWYQLIERIPRDRLLIESDLEVDPRFMPASGISTTRTKTECTTEDSQLQAQSLMECRQYRVWKEVVDQVALVWGVSAEEVVDQVARNLKVYLQME